MLALYVILDLKLLSIKIKCIDISVLFQLNSNNVSFALAPSFEDLGISEH